MTNTILYDRRARYNKRLTIKRKFTVQH